MTEQRDPSASEVLDNRSEPEKVAPVKFSIRWILSIEGVCGILLIEIVTFMFLVVVARYVFSIPLIWFEEIVRYSFTWLAFLSAAVAMKHGGHVAIEMINNLLPSGPERYLKIIVELTVAIFLALLVYYGTKMAIIAHGQRSSAMGLPMSVVYAAGPVGALLMGWYSIMRLITLIRKEN